MSSTFSENTHPSPLDDPSMDKSSVPPSKAKRSLATLGWILYGLACLIFFTVIKLPDEKIKGTINSMIANQLSTQGITFSASESDLSYGFGISYILKGVSLRFSSASTPPALIEKIEVSPSLFTLLFGGVGGALEIQQGEGRLSSSFSIKKTNISFDFKAKKMDIGKLGLLSALAGIQGSVVLDGKGSVEGDWKSPSTLEGSASLQLSRLTLDAQSIMGFPIPKIHVSEGNIEFTAEKAKVLIKNFQLGKAGLTPPDDLHGNLSGDITLTKQWESSTMNLKTRFSLSESILKSLVLLDAILGSGKQPDGGYSFSLSGPFFAPVAAPVKPGS